MFLVKTVHLFHFIQMHAKLFKIPLKLANTTDCINISLSTTGLILVITTEESETTTFEFSLIKEKEHRLSNGINSDTKVFCHLPVIPKVGALVHFNYSFLEACFLSFFIKIFKKTHQKMQSQNILDRILLQTKN